MFALSVRLLFAIDGIAVSAEGPAAPKPKASYNSKDSLYTWLLERGDFGGALDMRAWDLEPHRRDAPLRYENISDEEVREVQAAAAEILPRSYVSINGVVVGCPCEDGLKCTNQIWILARREGKATGLLLSRIGGHWVIGPVQRWYLRYEDMKRRHALSATHEQYERDRKESQEMLEQLPACESPLPDPGQPPAPRTSH
jgi:hypothetical protein